MASVSERDESHLRELLPRHVRGDADAFREFMEQFSQSLMTYLQRVGVRPENREDILQEILIAVHRNAGTYDPAHALQPWVFTIAVNKVRDHFRRLRWLSWVPLPSHFSPSHRVTPEQQFEEREDVAALQVALQDLPLKQREALIMQSVHGLELSEIAHIQKLPLNTVKTNVRRARERLLARRELVAKKGEGAHE